MIALSSEFIATVAVPSDPGMSLLRIASVTVRDSIGPAGVSALGAALRQLAALRELNLSANLIGIGTVYLHSSVRMRKIVSTFPAGPADGPFRCPDGSKFQVLCIRVFIFNF
jgi:hypothetical protein